MNFALSQRRIDRHPVGLLIVVGLHVLLAAALLSARLARPELAATAAVVLAPQDPPKAAEPDPRVLPKATEPVLHRPLVATPVIAVNPPPDTPVAATEEKTPPALIASAGGGSDDAVREPARVTPRPARIDAGAAQCRPDYPAAAQRAGATGTTVIRFSVDATGRISGSRIQQSSGASRENRLMDKAAAEALAQCPVQVGTDETGRPVGTTTDVTYVWSLN